MWRLSSIAGALLDTGIRRHCRLQTVIWPCWSCCASFSSLYPAQERDTAVGERREQSLLAFSSRDAGRNSLVLQMQNAALLSKVPIGCCLGLRLLHDRTKVAASRLNPKQLTAEVMSCSTVQVLQQLVQLRGQDMNYISIPAAVVQLQKLLSKLPSKQQLPMMVVSQALLDQLLQLLQQILTQCGARELANIIYALCMMPAAIRQQAAVQHALLPTFMQQHRQANPQEVSNVLYGMAKCGQKLEAVQVQQLLGQLCRQLDAADPQPISNFLWAVAAIGQQVEHPQLHELLRALLRQLNCATPQAVSSTVWAVATMSQQVPMQLLEQLLAGLTDKLHCAKSQAVSNTLWACGQLGYFPKQLLAATQVLTILPAAELQHLSNIAWACGQLGHRDDQLMAALMQQAVQQVACSQDHNTISVSTVMRQVLGNICWSIAVLDLQQHAADVLLLVQACRQQWGNMFAEDYQQLHQVHTWLVDCQLAGGQGLLGTLTPQQLQQCKEAWDEQKRHQQKAAVGKFQQAVFAAVQQLPISWQEPPQMEQLSVGRNGEVDGAALIDITARTADGVLLAIEADGPTPFRQPDGALTGPTLYRNRLLAARGYQLVTVPYVEWRGLRSKQQQQQQYLMGLVIAAKQRHNKQQQICAASCAGPSTANNRKQGQQGGQHEKRIRPKHTK